MAFPCHYVPVQDNGSDSMLPFLDEACDFIHQHRKMGSVLVHCKGGINRSPCLLVAYLMKYEDLSLGEALSLVAAARPAAHCPSNFRKDLQSFAAQLRPETAPPSAPSGNLSLFLNGERVGRFVSAIDPIEVMAPLYGMADIHVRQASEEYTVRSISLVEESQSSQGGLELTDMELKNEKTERSEEILQVEKMEVRLLLSRCIKRSRYSRLGSCWEAAEMLAQASCWLGMTEEFLTSHKVAVEQAKRASLLDAHYSVAQELFEQERRQLREDSSARAEAAQQVAETHQVEGSLVSARWNLRAFTIGPPHIRRIIQAELGRRKVGLSGSAESSGATVPGEHDGDSIGIAERVLERAMLSDSRVRSKKYQLLETQTDSLVGAFEASPSSVLWGELFTEKDAGERITGEEPPVLAKSLWKQNFTVCFLDMPGFGRSSMNMRWNIPTADWQQRDAVILAKFVNGMNFRNPVSFVGYRDSCASILRLCRDSPHLVANRRSRCPPRLVLTSGLVGFGGHIFVDPLFVMDDIFPIDPPYGAQMDWFINEKPGKQAVEMDKEFICEAQAGAKIPVQMYVKDRFANFIAGIEKAPKEVPPWALEVASTNASTALGSKALPSVDSPAGRARHFDALETVQEAAEVLSRCTTATRRDSLAQMLEAIPQAKPIKRNLPVLAALTNTQHDDGGVVGASFTETMRQTFRTGDNGGERAQRPARQISLIGMAVMKVLREWPDGKIIQAIGFSRFEANIEPQLQDVFMQCFSDVLQPQHGHKPMQQPPAFAPALALAGLRRRGRDVGKRRRAEESEDVEKQEAEVPTRWELLRFAAPLAAVSVTGPILSTIDTSFVGRCAGTLELAALGPACTVTDLIYLICSTISTAAINLYAGEDTKRKRFNATCVSVALCIGLTGAAVSTLLGRFLLQALGATPVMMGVAQKYVATRAVGLPLATIACAMYGLCVGKGDTKTPLIVTVYLSAVLNVFFDWLLCAVIPWGAAGAAWATVAAQVGSFVAYFTIMRRKKQLPLPSLNEIWITVFAFFALCADPMAAATSTKLPPFVLRRCRRSAELFCSRGASTAAGVGVAGGLLGAALLYFGAGAFTQDARVIQGAKIGVLPFVLSLGTGVIVRIVVCQNSLVVHGDLSFYVVAQVCLSGLFFLGLTLLAGRCEIGSLSAYRSMMMATFSFYVASLCTYGARVAKCTTLRELDLSDNHLGSKAVAKVLQAGRDNLQILDLSRNRLGDEGARALADALGKGPSSGYSLTVLRLRGNGISDDGGESLAEALMSVTTLLEFDFAENQISVQTAALLFRATCAAKVLKRLNLDSNLPWPTSENCEMLVAAFTDQLCGHQAVPSLELVSLRRCKMHSTGAVKLFHSVASNTTLRKLNVACNGLRQGAAPAIAAALATTGLEVLDLRDNRLGAFDALGLAFQQVFAPEHPHATGDFPLAEETHAPKHRENDNLRSLELRLYHNPLLGDLGAQALSDLLATPSGTSITHLNLAACGIGDAGCQALMQAVGDYKILKTLDLSCNGLGDDSASSVAEVLSQRDCELEKLMLSMNAMSSYGISELMDGDALACLAELQYWLVSRNVDGCLREVDVASQDAGPAKTQFIDEGMSKVKSKFVGLR
eukprot:g1911.t1